MKAFLLYILLAYLALAVQAIFFQGTKPDFVIVLVCFYALRHGQVKGCVYGAVTGLLIDTVSGFILGPHTISKALAGFATGSLRRHLFQWNIVISTAAAGMFALIGVIVIYVIYQAFSTVSFANRTIDVSVVEILYTVGAAMLLYPLFKPDSHELATPEV